jgi:thiol-disulfide isomerase/thioredoxin
LVPKETRETAPKLVLRDLEGQKRQLSQLGGQTVVVNFWATWCAPCRAEMPEFARVHSAYRDRGVEFIGAANERRSERDKIREFVRHLEIEFPIWLEASLDHLEGFGVGPGLPATVIVDPQGRIAARIKGPMDAAQLRDLLDRILLESTREQP